MSWGGAGRPRYGLAPFQNPCVLPQVIQGCGNPKVNPQGPGPEEKRRRGKLALQEKPPSGTLQKLVSGPGWAGRDRQAGPGCLVA